MCRSVGRGRDLGFPIFNGKFKVVLKIYGRGAFRKTFFMPPQDKVSFANRQLFNNKKKKKNQNMIFFLEFGENCLDFNQGKRKHLDFKNKNLIISKSYS